jgi:glycosyltransferase involved in cell wall biosynthesis
VTDSTGLRILRVAQPLYPAVTGGGAYHVHAMSRDQAAMGHDVTVLTIRSDPDRPHLERRDGYTVVRFDPTVRPLGNAVSPGLAQYLRAELDCFDVVHAHSHLYFSTNLAALGRALAGVPGVADRPLAITNHGLYSQAAPEWVLDVYLRTLGRATLNRADLVFCYTAADERRLREVGVSSPVAVVPNGIDTSRFTPEGPESDLLAAGDPAVLFVGRLVEGKRARDAVAAVERLRETHPDAHLYLCGDGPRRARLAAQAGDGVTLLGERPYGEMPDIYRAADALVLPSRAEGTPRTVLEALACDTPVVCSDLPHLRDAFGDAVRYVTVGDIADIRASLAAFCEASDGTTPPTGDTAGSVNWTPAPGPSQSPVTDWSETVRLTTERLSRLAENG